MTKHERDAADSEALDRVDVQHLPIGVYLVDTAGIFQGCNDGVREILSIDAGQEGHASLSQLLTEPGEFSTLTTAALEAESRESGFQKSILALAVDGASVFVENYLKPLRDPTGGEVVGFLGCMADITEEHAAARQSERLQGKVEELTFDIGRILHANTSTLLMVNQTLAAAAMALGRGDVPDPEDAPERAEEYMLEKADGLAGAIEQLLPSPEDAKRREALAPEQWQLLSNQVRLLRNLTDEVRVPELRGPTLRRAAAAVSDVCEAIEPGFLSRETVRRLARTADELLRLTSYYEVRRTQTTVVQMDFTLRVLRDFVTTEVRPEEKRRRLPVEPLVQEAVKQLADFARASNVDIVWRDRGSDLYVWGDERDLVRAVSNVLHNAVKYSWRRDRNNSPWVGIQVIDDEEARAVRIVFETWGVPITPNEIEQDLVFKMGYRGKLSKDRGRLGTGIGLTDSQRVARAHGGEVAIESRPAHSTSLPADDREYFERPFLTRVTLRLPRID